MNHVRDYHPLGARPSGYRCPKPFRYQYEGDVYQRDCGKCARCLAAKKRDVVARAAAEAMSADECVFITLTYRPGEAGEFQWLTKDRQAFMVRLRNLLYQRAERVVMAENPDCPAKRRGAVRKYWAPIISAAMQRVRYFGCGEVGSSDLYQDDRGRSRKATARNHWHLLLFFSGGRTGGCGLQSTPAGKNGRRTEHIDQWPHGHVTIDRLPDSSGDRVKAIRYIAMYLHKQREMVTSGGVSRPAAVMFRSMKPALGAAYLAGWAADHARAGLPLPSHFKVPGIGYSKGVRQGQATKNYLSGVVRDVVIAAYKDEWRRLRPEREIPHSDFLKRFDPDYCRPTGSRAFREPLRSGGRKRARRRALLVADGLRGVFAVWNGREMAGLVNMLRNGVCVWSPVDGDPLILTSLETDVIPGGKARSRLRRWIEGRRGPDWESPQARFERIENQKADQLRAMFRAFGRRDWVPGDETGKSPITKGWRRLQLGVEAKDGPAVNGGEVFPRPYVPPRDVGRLLRADDYPRRGAR